MLALAANLAFSGLPERPAWLIAMVVVGLVAALGRPQAVGSIQYSASGIVQIAAIPLLGPVGAAIIAALPVVADHNEALKRVFNVSQRILYVLAGALAYEFVGGRVLDTGTDGAEPLALAVRMGVAAVVAGIVNAVLLAGVLQQSSGGSLRVIFVDVLQQVLSSYSSSAVAAYLLVILWAPASLGWVSALLFLPPLLVIQWGLHQHASEWATRHEVLDLFVEALDLRRPGAARESRLATGAATAMATSLGLAPSQVDRVATAARVRDVGMLALDGAAPAIVRRDHAEAARRVVGSVTFLQPSLGLIASHHERIDGQGHPLGLSGDQIPLGSKIIAVADAWAHLVGAGRRPDDAVVHCESLVGQSLDRECVAALRRALDREQLPREAP